MRWVLLVCVVLMLVWAAFGEPIRGKRGPELWLRLAIFAFLIESGIASAFDVDDGIIGAGLAVAVLLALAAERQQRRRVGSGVRPRR